MKVGILSSKLYVDFLLHYHHQILFTEELAADDQRLRVLDY